MARLLQHWTGRRPPPSAFAPRPRLPRSRRPEDVPHLWLPATVSRFDGWLVEHHDVAAEVVDALDAIARTPYDPPFPTRPYLGDDLAHSFVSSINEDIDLVFKVFRDQ